MIPLYEKKAKCDTETIKNLIEVESWLSAKEVDDLFNINLLNETKEGTACLDKNLFKCYKNVPDMFKNKKEEPKQQEIVEVVQNIDYSYFDNKLNFLKEEK